MFFFQGVSFRANTLAKAQSLGMTGYVKNDPSGTVLGTAQGTAHAASELRYWLENVGSPAARIDRAVFKNFRTEKESDFSHFFIQYEH